MGGRSYCLFFFWNSVWFNVLNFFCVLVDGMIGVEFIVECGGDDGGFGLVYGIGVRYVDAFLRFEVRREIFIDEEVVIVIEVFVVFERV